MEQEIPEKDTETREVVELPGLRVPSVEPVKSCYSMREERSESLKAETPRTARELQGVLEVRAFSSGDISEQGRIAEEPETLGDNEGAKLEDSRTLSVDCYTPGQEAKEQPMAMEARKAVEGPPEGAGCIPCKDSLAQSQQTFESPSSTES